MKKCLSLLLAFSLMLCVSPTAFAASGDPLDAANRLYALGLFQGTGANADGTPNFDLDRVPTRTEAVTMLVRLLGKDHEAKAGTWEIPFTDVAEWARPYVGYAYANKLTTGTGATTFGGDSAVTPTQYLTFVLRALGYTSGTDFQWDRAWELSDKIGMTHGEYSGAANSDFLRGDLAKISFDALPVSTKDSGKTLAQEMIAQGVFTEEQYETVIETVVEAPAGGKAPAPVFTDVLAYLESLEGGNAYGDVNETGRGIDFMEKHCMDELAATITKNFDEYSMDDSFYGEEKIEWEFAQKFEKQTRVMVGPDRAYILFTEYTNSGGERSGRYLTLYHRDKFCFRQKQLSGPTNFDLMAYFLSLKPDINGPNGFKENIQIWYFNRFLHDEIVQTILESTDAYQNASAAFRKQTMPTPVRDVVGTRIEIDPELSFIDVVEFYGDGTAAVLAPPALKHKDLWDWGKVHNGT